MIIYQYRIVCSGALVGLLWSSLAAAQPPLADQVPDVAHETPALSVADNVEPGGTDKPWVVGVSDADKKRVRWLVARAYKLHEQFLFEGAADLYEQAIKHWAHPAIHLSLATLYSKKSELRKAHHHLQQAVRFGAEPLEEGEYQRAQDELQRLRELLSELTISCTQEGAIWLDDRFWLACPGERSEVLQPGVYRLQTEQSDHVGLQQELALLPGRRVEVVPEPIRLDALYVTRRRGQRWLPWTVLGAGAAAGLLSAALFWDANRNIAAGDAVIEALVPPGGVSSGADRPAEFDRADRELLAGGSLLALSGAGLVVGSLLLYRNRKRRYPSGRSGRLRLQILPFTNSRQGLTASIRF